MRPLRPLYSLSITVHSLAVVIPTFNRKTYLRTLLDQLLRQEGSDFRLSVVVVVDGSTDGTDELLRTEFPAVHVVPGTGQWWFTRCVNEGIRFARQHLSVDQILVMNDDSELDTSYVSTLLRCYREAGPRSVLGSLSVTRDAPARVTFSGNPRTLRWLMKQDPYVPFMTPYRPAQFTGLHPTQTLNGRGMLLPVAVLDEIGLFDERRFPQYGSDDDMALRAVTAGIPTYVAWEAVVYDHTGMTSAGTVYLRPPLKTFLKSFFNPYSVNSLTKTFHFYRKHGLPLLWPVGFALSLVATVRAYAWKYRRQQPN